MPDTYVELEEIPVLRVRADLTGAGPAAAFAALEHPLPTLRGRRFWGTFRMIRSGPEYYACVERVAEDQPEAWKFEVGTIPGGLYARRRLDDWKRHVEELPRLFQEMIVVHDHDPMRPTLELYRSDREMLMHVPVRSRRG